MNDHSRLTVSQIGGIKGSWHDDNFCITRIKEALSRKKKKNKLTTNEQLVSDFSSIILEISKQNNNDNSLLTGEMKPSRKSFSSLAIHLWRK